MTWLRTQLVDNHDTLNSLTKWPSIPVLHPLDERGRPHGAPILTGKVGVSEKIDGTNARIVIGPDGDFVIGSRKELLRYSGDALGGDTMGIVSHLMQPATYDAARKMADAGALTVLYGEVYGGTIQKAAKQYTGGDRSRMGFCLFGGADIPLSVAGACPSPQDASRAREAWTYHGHALAIRAAAEFASLGYATVPDLGGHDVPADPADVWAWLKSLVPQTGAQIGDAAPGHAEGVVLMDADGRAAKARFYDYAKVRRSAA